MKKILEYQAVIIVYSIVIEVRSGRFDVWKEDARGDRVFDLKTS